MSQLTLLTINCLGLPVPVPGIRRRLNALGQAIADAKPDVACLQEVGRWRHLPLLRHAESFWPHAIAMPHPYAPKGGLVTMSKLPVLETNYRRFEARGSVASLHATERHQSKGILRTSVVVAHRPIVVFNTHLAANYSATWSTNNPYAQVERDQLRELAQWVRTVPQETIVVVAGDFNVPRGSWLYEEFLDATGLADPLADSTAPTYRPLPGLPARAAQALDHVLVRAPADITYTVQAELCFNEPMRLEQGFEGYLSDHMGVRMTLRWTDSSPLPDDDDRHESQDVPTLLNRTND